MTEHAPVQTLPASLPFLAVRLGVVALLIPIVWLWLGAVAGAATAMALVAVAVLFVPRALVLDDEGFRQLSLVPRKKVLWSRVDSFNTGSAPRAGAFVLYTKAGRRPHWWYPAGWPAQGGIPPAFASTRAGRALSASDLSELLNDRLARARTVSER
jgi:type IV secretory pathway VirB3-like protein